MSYFNDRIPKVVTFIVTVVILVLSGFSTSILEGGVFGKAYLFPNEHNAQMVMFGIGLVGFIIALTKSFVKFWTENLNYYFYAGSAFLIVCLISSFLTLCLPYSRKYFYNSVTQCEISDDSGYYGDDDISFTIQNVSFKKSINSWERAWYIFKRLKHYCFYIFITFFVTMSIYPGISSVLPTSFPGTFMDDWYPEILILLMCTFDFVGRTIPGLIKINHKDCFIRYIVVWGRIHFVILFSLYIHPIFFLHCDVVPILMMIVMGITNGYFSCIIVNKAKKLLSDEDSVNKEIGGNMITFFMLVGISVGSISSIGIFYSTNVIFQFIKKKG